MASSKRRSSASLPFELVEEILFRIPFDSSVRFKSTCKQWYTLFNDKRFIHNNLLMSQEKQQFMQFDGKRIQLFKPETKGVLRLPVPDELHNQIFIEKIHCDGLLMSLCKCREGGMFRNRKLAVWNPFSSRVKWIKLSTYYSPFDVYGFGYDAASRDNYKILRINVDSSETLIYEFKSKLWRSVDATLGCALLRKPLSMNGNMYWIAQKEGVKSKFGMLIQSFDFSTETFKPIYFHNVPRVITKCLSVNSDRTIVLPGFGGDRLSLLHQHTNLEIEVWITNKVTDGIVSWRKYFNVTRPDLPMVNSRNLCGFRMTFTFSIQKTNKITLWYKELDAEKMRIHANVFTKWVRVRSINEL